MSPAPEAGDYESAESPVLKLAASQQLGNFQVFCTNRVGKVEQFAAEDEKWAKENPPEEFDSTALRNASRATNAKC
jgi:hypothetical protein